MANKEWFSRAKVGLFTHYTFGTYPPDAEHNWGGTCKSAQNLTGADNIDQLADAFDARRYAQTAASMGAQYVTFTLCHAGFNILFPSNTMIETGLIQKVSRRDVIRELLDELTPYGIKLVLYMPPNDTHDLTKEEKHILGWEDVRVRSIFNSRLAKEICERYEKKIAGFWFDNCGPERIVSDTIKGVDQNAVIFVNYGITENDEKFDPTREDFRVSEYYGQAPSTPSDNWPTHHTQINRIFGGGWWAQGGKANNTAREMFRWTVRVAATQGQCNGGVNWAAGPYMDNEWENGIEELMNNFGILIKRYEDGLFDTVPSVAYPTPNKSVLSPDHWGVATQSADGVKTYLHVLNEPSSNALKISAAADGRQFACASIMGQDAGIENIEGGWIITLPPGNKWDSEDTVITLW